MGMRREQRRRIGSVGRRTDVGRGTQEHIAGTSVRDQKGRGGGRRRNGDVTRSWGPVSRTEHAEIAFPRHEINRESGAKSRVMAPPIPTLIAGARHGGRGDRNTTLSATVQKCAKQRDFSKNPCPQIPAPGPLHTTAPDMQRLGDGLGTSARAGTAGVGRLPAAWAGRPAVWPRNWSAAMGTCAQGGWDAWQSEAACCSWTSS